MDNVDAIQLLQSDSAQNIIDDLQAHINSLLDYMRNQTGVPKEYMQHVENH